MNKNLLAVVISTAALSVISCGPSTSIIPTVSNDNSDDASLDANFVNDASDANADDVSDATNTWPTNDGNYNVIDSGVDSNIPDSGGKGRIITDSGNNEPDSAIDSGTLHDSGTVVDSGEHKDASSQNDSGTCKNKCSDEYSSCVYECHKLNTCDPDLSECNYKCVCAETTCNKCCE
jgi:hypothetical protein